MQGTVRGCGYSGGREAENLGRWRSALCPEVKGIEEGPGDIIENDNGVGAAHDIEGATTTFRIGIDADATDF